MALIARLLKRYKDHLREGRIDAYASLALRAQNSGNNYRMVYYARLMRVEMSARSDQQLARMAKAAAKRRREPSRV